MTWTTNTPLVPSVLNSLTGGLGLGTTMGLDTTIGAIQGMTNTVTALRKPTMKDLDGPVMNASITALTDMWRAKYGNDWVSVTDLKKDEFYELAAQRLLAHNKLETHRLGDNWSDVYKLVEDK